MFLSLVVPCFNEEEVFLVALNKLERLFNKLISENLVASNSEIVFVDDGSSDKTWSFIVSAAKENKRLRGIRLSRNCGHQNALMAGLKSAKGECVITIDADLQDDVEAIREMVILARAGSDVVYGVRKERNYDTWFKRSSAIVYYRILALMGVDVVFNHADYRLMSRRVLNALFNYSEVNLYLRGIIPQLGFNSSIVYYKRSERLAGVSKYPLKKMIALAWQGVTSFSVAPLRLISLIGIMLFFVSMGIAIWVVDAWLMGAARVPGWVSVVLPMVFLGGVQLLSIGIVGEYLGKVYLEVKRRPPFFIAETVEQSYHPPPKE
jgi:glycosyltransferase involved in cell wall biosynthesis